LLSIWAAGPSPFPLGPRQYPTLLLGTATLSSPSHYPYLVPLHPIYPSLSPSYSLQPTPPHHHTSSNGSLSSPFIPVSHPATLSSACHPIITLSLLGPSPPHLSQSLTQLFSPAHATPSSHYPYLVPLYPIYPSLSPSYSVQPRHPIITLSLLGPSPPHLSKSLIQLLSPAHATPSSHYPYLLPLHPIYVSLSPSYSLQPPCCAIITLSLLALSTPHFCQSLTQLLSRTHTTQIIMLSCYPYLLPLHPIYPSLSPTYSPSAHAAPSSPYSCLLPLHPIYPRSLTQLQEPRVILVMTQFM
jgi:hypothetical protein